MKIHSMPRRTDVRDLTLCGEVAVDGAMSHVDFWLLLSGEHAPERLCGACVTLRAADRAWVASARR